MTQLILQFFVEYTIHNNTEEDKPGRPIRDGDLGRIATNYLKTDFPLDFITLIPLNFFQMYRRRNALLSKFRENFSDKKIYLRPPSFSS